MRGRRIPTVEHDRIFGNEAKAVKRERVGERWDVGAGRELAQLVRPNGGPRQVSESELSAKIHFIGAPSSAKGGLDG